MKKQKLIEGGDAEANYAYYALHEFHILPGAFMRLPRNEKALVYAMIDIRIKKEKQDMAKAKKKR